MSGKKGQDKETSVTNTLIGAGATVIVAIIGDGDPSRVEIKMHSAWRLYGSPALKDGDSFQNIPGMVWQWQMDGVLWGLAETPPMTILSRKPVKAMIIVSSPDSKMAKYKVIFQFEKTDTTH